MNHLANAVAIAALLVASGTAAAANPPAQAAPKAAKRTCDPTKIHTGPRGGKYTLTRDCKKVYQKRR